MMPHPWRERVGKALRPVLESAILDKVKYVGPVRRFARDWAVALGFWDDGLLEKEMNLKPIDLAASAARTKRGKQASLTLYVDARDAATDKMKALLDEEDVRYRIVDIAADDPSRKWLAEEFSGARPPQLFVEGQRLGGLAEIQALRNEGKLGSHLFPRGE